MAIIVVFRRNPSCAVGCAVYCGCGLPEWWRSVFVGFGCFSALGWVVVVCCVGFYMLLWWFMRSSLLPLGFCVLWAFSVWCAFILVFFGFWRVCFFMMGFSVWILSAFSGHVLLGLYPDDVIHQYVIVFSVYTLCAHLPPEALHSVVLRSEQQKIAIKSAVKRLAMQTE